MTGTLWEQTNTVQTLTADHPDSMLSVSYTPNYMIDLWKDTTNSYIVDVPVLVNEMTSIFNRIVSLKNLLKNNINS